MSLTSYLILGLVIVLILYAIKILLDAAKKPQENSLTNSVEEEELWNSLWGKLADLPEQNRREIRYMILAYLKMTQSDNDSQRKTLFTSVNVDSLQQSTTKQ